MDKNGLPIVLLLLFMFILGRSNALNSRKLVSTSDPNGSSNAIQDTPSSTSINDKKLNPPPVEPSTKPDDIPNTNPSNVEAKDLNDDNTKTNPENSTDKKVDKEKSEDVKQKVEAETLLETFSNKSCKGNPVCTDQEKTMIACIQDFESGSNNLTLIVQNEQDTNMKVNITSGTSMNDNFPAFEIPGHVTKQVNFKFTGDKTTKLTINSGTGFCDLQISQLKTTTPVNDPPKVILPETPPNPKDIITPADTPIKPKEPIKEPPIPKPLDTPATSSKDDVPVPQNNFLDQLTFYSKQVTPMHGAYLAFFVALVIGGSWALCSFRKRRNDGGVAYQELEMGVPEASNAVDVETVEGWDQDWDDDDWDEDKAIRSPGGGLKTVSSNGLTSQGGKKDGWDADWDD
ncbi:hypothetical protein LXL04_035959 [Taraxacum kok-saghyz]